MHDVPSAASAIDASLGGGPASALGSSFGSSPGTGDPEGPFGFSSSFFPLFGRLSFAFAQCSSPSSQIVSGTFFDGSDPLQLTFGTHDEGGAQFWDADTLIFPSTAVNPAEPIDP